VKGTGKLALLLLAMTLFASPLMACLQPENTLTPEERECCRQMAGQCDQMPTSHSCCKPIVRESDPYIGNSRTVLPADQAPAVLQPVDLAAGLPQDISLFAVLHAVLAIPESPPGQSSILRI
jgi:hypothetical protein